jgi:ribosomal protein S4
LYARARARLTELRDNNTDIRWEYHHDEVKRARRRARRRLGLRDENLSEKELDDLKYEAGQQQGWTRRIRPRPDYKV